MKAYAIKFRQTWFFGVENGKATFHPKGGQFTFRKDVADSLVRLIKIEVESAGGNTDEVRLVEFELDAKESADS